MNSRLHVAALVAIALPVSLAADIVRLAGSDLAGPELAAVLKANSPSPGGEWLIDLAGTKPGLDALRAGKADIALVLLESLPTASDPGIEYMPLAYRAPVVVVSERNPLAGLSLSALAAVLGEGETENYRRWSDLGLPETLAAADLAMRLGAE